MSWLRELWKTEPGRIAHYLVASAIACVAVVEMAASDVATGLTVALSVVLAIALVFTRDAPFVAPLAVTGVLVAMVWTDEPTMEEAEFPFLIVLFVPWCLGTYNDRLKAIVGLVYFLLFGFWANLQFENAPGDYFWIAAFSAVAWATGFVVSRRSQYAREMADRARRLERVQKEAAEFAVNEERQRIARELHDVIAHSVSVMTVQAGAVRRLLKPEQEKERQALETVEATGREALTEMRRLVGLLREQGAMPEFSPQPGLATIESLLEGVRAAGLPVELDVAGEPRELPPGVDLAAYRVVQEALTNALKYAGPAQAWVAVGWGEDDLELEIANDGRGDGDGTGGGQGLAGMRERVSLYGGDIESGAREGGGYFVRARIPLAGAAR